MGKATIPKDLQPLYEEAKKYKSEEERLRSNLEPWFDPRINMIFVVKTPEWYIDWKVNRVALRQTKSWTKNIDLKLSNWKTITFDPWKKWWLLELKNKSLDIKKLRKIREEANLPLK